MNRTALRTLTAVAFSAALATSLAACGDDDKDGDAKATPLTAEEFKTQANAICKAQDAEEERTFTEAQQAGTSGDEAGAKAALDEGVDVIRGEADAIAALNPPEDLKDEVDALVTSLNEALDKVKAEGVTAVPALADPSAKAQALGLTECGN